MRSRIAILALLAGIVACNKPKPSPAPDPAPIPPAARTIMRGVDLSYTPEIRSVGTVYKYNNTAGDILDICKARGINTVRLRLWYNPASSRSGLSEVLNFATEIKNKGLYVYLDIHYSDTWADPGVQTKPAAWQSLSLAALNDSVYRYTKRVVQAFSDAGAKPLIVQIGNETNSGFLWSDGRVGGAYDVNWPAYANLVKQGIRGVKEVDPAIKTMIHFAGYSGADWFFGNLRTQAVDYDYIGISYYPIWHGKDLAQLSQNLNSLASNFNKPIIIAETNYAFTLGWNDQTNNLIGLPDQLIPAYPASPAGQASFMGSLIRVIYSVPNAMGQGVCYWAPDMVAYRGTTATNGSAFENIALFDFANNALPALDSLGTGGR